MSLDAWFALAADLGLEGTEIHSKSLADTSASALQGVTESLHANQLQLSQLICASDFTNPDSDVREKEVQALRRYIDTASALQSCCVRITAGQAYPDVTSNLSTTWVVECFRRILDYAQKKGVWLAYENHYKDFFWTQPDFSMKQDVYLDILERLADTPLKVNFDCSNPLMAGEDPLTLLQQVVDRVVHVHCSDRASMPYYAHSVPGEGLVDFGEIFRTLKRAGWDGWLSVEYGGGDGLEGLTRACKYVRAKWAESD